MIEFLIIREPYRGEKFTRGELFNKETNEFICFTLEDRLRNKFAAKVFGKTAIPYGLYTGHVRLSPSRRRLVPWIDDVPGFKYIQIHSGNTVKDSKGCILVGFKRFKDEIWESREAEKHITNLIRQNGGTFKIHIS